MKITIVQGAFLPVPPVAGGAVEKIWYALGREFARRGHQVCHISRSYPGLAARETNAGVEYPRIPGYDTPTSLLKLKLQDLLYSRRALKVIPKSDIVVTNTFWLPVLLSESQHGKIYVHVARYPKGQMRLYWKAARLQGVSLSTSQAICRDAPGLSSLVGTVPYFISGVRNEIAAGQSNHILYVGRIAHEKGIHLLVKSFAALVGEGLEKWRLRIVGPWQADQGGGGERYFRELQSLAEPVSDRVEWIGPVYDGAQLNALYREAALFVYPSLADRGETFGLAPLEAMSQGCPVLVSNLGCFLDFVQPGHNGWTFDHTLPHPEIELERALKQILSDRAQLFAFARSALSRAREFTLEKVADQYLSDFEKVLSNE